MVVGDRIVYRKSQVGDQDEHQLPEQFPAVAPSQVPAMDDEDQEHVEVVHEEKHGFGERRSPWI